jgi:hypothetical protein
MNDQMVQAFAHSFCVSGDWPLWSTICSCLVDFLCINVNTSFRRPGWRERGCYWRSSPHLRYSGNPVLAALRDEGLIVTTPGWGSFVAERG